jgi:drug/metabolite transporter (DMT)-like permease
MSEAPTYAVTKETSRTRNLAHLLCFLCVVIFGTSFVVVRNIYEQYPPSVLSLWRWGGATLLLLPMVWSNLREDWPLVRRQWGFFAACGLLMPVIGALTGYLAMAKTVAVNGAIIQTMLPALVVLLAWIVRLESINARQITGLLIAAVGVLGIVTKADATILLSLGFNVGDLMLLFSACGLAAYTVLFTRNQDKPRPLVCLTVIFGIGAIFHLPIVAVEFWQGTPMPFTLETGLSIVFVAIFPSLLAVMFYNYGIEKLGPSTAATYHYFMPVITAILAYVFLGEAFAWYHAIGTGMILSGVYLAASSKAVRA